MPVIGGYLAFIGWFCIEGGISISAGVSVADPADWLQPSGADWLRVLPAALIGVAYFILCRRFSDPHPWSAAVLPVGLVAVPLMFYLLLLCTGTSLEEARDRKWVMQLQNSSGSTDYLWAPFEAYDIGVADMSALPKLIPTWLAMVAIVAFSSSLDVAAIELDMGTSIDYDQELQLVGVSNVISGLSGGFTGSYSE
jgi:SulP family sulfate permease